MKISVSHNSRNLFLILSLLLCLLLLFSCKKEKAGKEEVKDNKKIHESVERGPARIILDIDKKEITIAERINLSISVDIEEDYEVELPAFGEKLEQFGIVDYHNSTPELINNNRKLIKRTYILEPFLSGEYKITPMKIMFFKKVDEKTAKHTIETPEVTIKVHSLLPENVKDLKLNEIVPPLSYPGSYMIWIYSGAGLLLIIIIAGFFYYRSRINNRGAVELRLKAHEIAYNELKALVDENLIDAGEIKQFYLRLSAIIRRYIENRFGLRAPEQTTEEFLFGLEKAGEFPVEYKPLLRDFLKHCDLVKFARFEPGIDDIQKSFDSCKAFIKGTEEQE